MNQKFFKKNISESKTVNNMKLMILKKLGLFAHVPPAHTQHACWLPMMCLKSTQNAGHRRHNLATTKTTTTRTTKTTRRVYSDHSGWTHEKIILSPSSSTFTRPHANNDQSLTHRHHLFFCSCWLCQRHQELSGNGEQGQLYSQARRCRILFVDDFEQIVG